ncbi:molecular chaperone DnaK [Pancytospora epiphaga]|nr:molecular chaperone DnaK [Pancytospora epiphaga]
MTMTNKDSCDIVGIDLGTTNSAIAIFKDGIPQIIRNKLGKSTTPSIVHLAEPEIVGESARDMLLKDPENTIFGSKRLIGRKMEDVAEYVSSLPYGTTKKCNGDVWIKTGLKKYSPSEIGAKILGYLRGTCEKFLKKPVKKAVLTVPAYFNDSQRQATKDAGKIAGIDVIRIINEPTAAALAYGMDKKEKGHIAVYDLGGGTFDISILELDNGVFHVRSTAGDTFLGGEDFDGEICKFLIHRFEEEENIKIDDKLMNNDIKARVREAAERAKIELSTKIQTRVYIDKLVDGCDMDIKITRQQLESVVRRVAERTRSPCERAIRDAGLLKSDIGHVILVGGMTRMPAIRNLVTEIFGKTPYTDIDPDEAVALGAAVQAGILSGTVGDKLLLDVAPLSLGIEVLGGIFSKVVDRNTTIPCRRTETFSTSEDGQTEVDIRIFQGERSMVGDNKYLGSVRLVNIPKAARGDPRIAVTFEIDVNGCVSVSAEDSVTKKPVSVKLTPDSGLSVAEVERMVAEAEAQKKEDQLKEKRILFRLSNVSYVDSLLKVKMPEEIRQDLLEFQKYIRNDGFDVDKAERMLKKLKEVL